MSALTGIRVVELANERCAYAGKLLGDMGADVVLVEAPGGEPSRTYPPFANDQPGPDSSLYWWHYNTSKRSVVMDLEREAGRDAYRKLLATADVLVESEAPGRLAELALDYDDRTASRPDLIHVSITPFGRENSRRDEPVTDLTILAGGGPVWSCGYDDHSIPPIRGGGNQGYHTACHYAVMSALTAILYRGVSGEGQFIDVSMHAAANVTTEMASYHWLVEQTTVMRQTGRHATTVATMPVQVACADGGFATMGMPPRTPKGFGDLYDWMEELGLTSRLPESVFLEKARHRESIGFADIGVDDEVTAAFSAAREATAIIAGTLSANDFFLGAQKIGITVGAIYSPEEAYEDPHFVDRGYQVEVEHPELGRRIRYPGAPYKLPASPWAISRRAPQLGEHDAEILDELRIDEATRAELR
ncbi:MAG: carnitine dehydratase [Deltaproteobacteria bacterium]|nr:carnitine dehydratase [Deltaproteobacteria bacterium]